MRHEHNTIDYNKAFAIGVSLNIIFVFIEAIYGIFAGSLALIADAGHNLSDVIGLLLAWGASILAMKAATRRRTYGFRKVTVFASLVSAVILIITLGVIVWESVIHILHPTAVKSTPIITVAAIGVIINSLTALFFVRGQKKDLNIRGAFLHMSADAGVSLGVVIAGIIIMKTGWFWVDPVVSIAIVLVIIIGMKSFLTDSFNYAIDGVPTDIDVEQIKNYLLSLRDVVSIHDLHVWPLSTTETALTVHILVDSDRLDNAFLNNIQNYLYNNFGIEHATIQIESMSGENNCMLDDGDC